MWSIMSNILNLIQKFLYIINNRYSEILCAKYDSSIMNGVCIVCPANYVSLPAKVVQLTAFFSKKSDFCTAFVSATSQLTQGSAHEVCLKYNILD